MGSAPFEKISKFVGIPQQLELSLETVSKKVRNGQLLPDDNKGVVAFKRNLIVITRRADLA